MARRKTDLDVDERGRVSDPEDNRERTGSKTKKRKRDTKSEKLKELASADEDAPKKKRRRKTVEEEPAAVKKKRTRKIDTPASSKQLARIEKKKAVLEKELQWIPSASSDDEFDRQYRRMFERLQSITETFEVQMEEKPTGRDVYALSTLYSQMREVIADMRSSKDVESQIRELEARAYEGFLKAIGQAFVDLLFTMSRDIRKNVREKDVQDTLINTLNGVAKDRTDEIMASYHKMVDNVRTVLM